MDNDHRVELIFLELMSEMGIEDDAGVGYFYAWASNILERACKDFKADAGWEDDEDD